MDHEQLKSACFGITTQRAATAYIRDLLDVSWVEALTIARRIGVSH